MDKWEHEYTWLARSSGKRVRLYGVLHLTGWLDDAVIAYLQKEWKTGARVGARSVMGSFGAHESENKRACSPASDLIIEHAPTLA